MFSIYANLICSETLDIHLIQLDIMFAIIDNIRRTWSNTYLVSKTKAVAIKFDTIKRNFDIIVIAKYMFNKIGCDLCNYTTFVCNNCKIDIIGC